MIQIVVEDALLPIVPDDPCEGGAARQRAGHQLHDAPDSPGAIAKVVNDVSRAEIETLGFVQHGGGPTICAMNSLPALIDANAPRP
jgi:hypothetical protein